jgi:Asp-tRNA(Asn)/Glu-tRNA(Gln) amidotransferase A subunit family amidase
MSSRPADVTATGLASLIRRSELSAVEAVDDALARIEHSDPRIGAFLTVAADAARRGAAAADRALRNGAPVGPLHGVPVAVKDLEWTAGIRTTYGSRAFESFVPNEDAIDVARLRAAGAIVIGKTNTPEFGLIGETRNLLAPETRNPLDLERTVGGSSGGSAAAVAAGMVTLATGNDTAGSITCPAAMCGVFGIKPTHGRVPNWPEPGDSRLFLDSGPIARSVADAAVMLGVMSGPDARDPISLAPGAARERRGEPRVAWSPDWGHLAVDGEVRRIAEDAARMFEELGYRVEADRPDAGDPMEILLPLIAGDALELLANLGIDRDALSPDSRAELHLLGEPDVTAYIAALNRLWHFRAALDRFFETYELMITPSTAVPAFPLGAPPAVIDGRPVAARWTTFMPFQAPWNLSGQPTATVPCGRTASGLPVGLQISAARGDDDRLLEACAAFEQAAAPRAPA